jgi:hypothetical protein
MALNEMGKAALKEVWSQIGQRGINDERGRVRRWQSYHVGRWLGYVAVQPDSGDAAEVVQTTKAGEKTTSKDVTRYLEHGHKVRGPSGRAKRYTPRYKRRLNNNGRSMFTVVHGRLFYSWSRDNVARIAAHEAERNVLVPLENMLDDLCGG